MYCSPHCNVLYLQVPDELVINNRLPILLLQVHAGQQLAHLAHVAQIGSGLADGLGGEVARSRGDELEVGQGRD